jgi:glucosamine--fructose-6-phosphate aminotransferase (isomerizing)
METKPTDLQPSATLAEIFSEPEAWQMTLCELREDPTIARIVEDSRGCTEWLFIGCGTSFYLAEAAANSWTLLTGQRARALPGSEPLLFPALALAKEPRLQAVVISRSGKTSEALRAAKVFKSEFHVPTIGITCATSTPLEEICDATIQITSADEKSTVMTRSFTSMLLALQHLAARTLKNESCLKSLESMAAQFAPQIAMIAEKVQRFVAKHDFEDYVFLGQGPFYGIAREASLKVMEMSCSYSQAFHALEFRHGPKAIVSANTCLMFFLSENGYQAEEEVLVEMAELGGVIITICNRASEDVRRNSDLVLELGFDGPEVARLAPYVVPAQLLGFFTGTKKNLDPDNPRNLTRVVILD